MTDIRACVLGCTAHDGTAYRAAPGRLTCNTCADRLWQILTDIASVYNLLTDIDELTPGGHGDTTGRRPPGPRSPAVDALLVHTDPRSRYDGHPAALATIESWARLVREERSIDVPPGKMLATVPAGRITLHRELQTLRFEWHWVCGQPWVDDFAAEMRDLHATLQHIGRMLPPVMRIGTCPVVVDAVEVPGGVVPLLCAAPLRVRVDAHDIRCRGCGTVWPRARWSELGDPWADYASLTAELGVPGGTLRRWCHEDGWRVTGTVGRRLVARADAVASYARHRGGTPAVA